MYEPQKYIEQPLQLLEVNQSDQIVLKPQAMQFLGMIPKPISVVCIAGPYRTGKSYLLNSLINSRGAVLANKEKTGFQVGRTTNACTRGIWIWSKPVLSVDEHGNLTNVVLMDSEGFGEGHRTHDHRIIILALLMSTCFLYNSKGSIDKASMCDLSYVTDIADTLRTQAKFVRNTDFHWIVRDFQFQLVNEMGGKISPAQYMENAFATSGQSVVSSLQNYFTTRSCHILPFPSLSEQPHEEKPEFLQKVLELKKILQRVSSLQTSGENFCHVIQSYVNQLNLNPNSIRICMEGYDCNIRLICLQKLSEKLDAIDECSYGGLTSNHVENIRTDLNEFYSNRMCSQKQREKLRAEVDQIIREYMERVGTASGPQSQQMGCQQSQFRGNNDQIGYLKGDGNKQLMIQSLQSAHVPVSSLSDSFVVTACNLDQRNSAEAVEVTRNSMSRALHRCECSKNREQLEVKIHLQELQLNSLQIQNEKLSQSLGEKQQIIRQLDEQLTNVKNQSIRLNGIATQLQVQNQVTIGEHNQQTLYLSSEIRKQEELYAEKIEFLQQELKSSSDSHRERIASAQNKHQSEITELINERAEILRHHAEQIEQIKQIYQSELINSKTPPKDLKVSDDSHITEEYVQLMQELEACTQEKQEYQQRSQQLQGEIQSLNQRFAEEVETSAKNLENLNRRNKQAIRGIESICQEQLKAKQLIIREQTVKISELNQKLHQQSEEILNNFEYSTNGAQKQQANTYEEHMNKMKQNYLQMSHKSELLEKILCEKDTNIHCLQQDIQKHRNKYTALEILHHQTCSSSTQTQKRLYNDLCAQQSKVRQLSGENRQLQEEIELQRAQFDKFEEETQKLYDLQRQSSKEKISNLNAQIQKSEAHQSALMQENKDLNDRLCLFGEELEQRKGEIKEFIEINQRDRTRVEYLETQIELINTRNSQLKVATESSQAKSEETVMQIKEENCALLQKYQNTLNQLHACQHELYKLQQKLEHVEKARENSYQASEKSHQAKEHKNLVEIQRLRDQQKEWEDKYGGILSQYNALQTHESLYQQEIQHLQGRLEKQKKLMQDHYSRQAESAKQSISKLKRQISASNETIRGLEGQISASNETISGLEGQISAFESQSNKVRQELGVLETDHHQTLQYLQAVTAKHQKNIEAYEITIRSLRNRIDDLEQQKLNYQQTNQNLYKQCEYLASTKSLIESNYEQDFRLWTGKLKSYENILESMRKQSCTAE